jgi:peptide subunit release factor 1 (eRF1)
MKYTLPPREWYKTNRFVKELETTYVPPVTSVYAPSKKVDRVIRILEREKESEMEEIKKSIVKELDALRGSTGSFCIFGWKEGENVIVKHIIISSDVPPAYLVDDKPFLEPLREVLEIRYDLLLVLLDHRQALLRLYGGSEVRKQKRIRSYVISKHHKGGWSQKRFSRIRKIQVERHFKTVQEYLEGFDLKTVDAIILAGPGEAKKDFARVHITKEIADKTAVARGLDFSSDDKEIGAVLINQLNKYREKRESGLLSSVRENMKRELVLNENREIQRALERGAVGTILIASDYYAATSEEDEMIIRMIEEAEHTSAEVEFITKEAILKEMHKHGNLVALLRYKPF